MNLLDSDCFTVNSLEHIDETGQVCIHKQNKVIGMDLDGSQKLLEKNISLLWYYQGKQGREG